MYYTYVLQSSKDNNFYTGYTDDLKNRVTQHNKGLNLSTKFRRPLKLIYYEACLNKKDAKQREKYLKSGIRKRFLKQRLKNYLNKK
ncbi:MAG: GIY-YIG nuclease family protein [bacterium]